MRLWMTIFQMFGWSLPSDYQAILKSESQNEVAKRALIELPPKMKEYEEQQKAEAIRMFLLHLLFYISFLILSFILTNRET